MKVLPQSKIFQSKRNFHVQYRQNILNILNAFPYIKQKHPLDYNRVLKFIGNDNDYKNNYDVFFDIAGALLKHLLAFQVMNHTETMCLRAKRFNGVSLKMKLDAMDSYNSAKNLTERLHGVPKYLNDEHLKQKLNIDRLRQ